jgi:hypothetical protein
VTIATKCASLLCCILFSAGGLLAGEVFNFRSIKLLKFFFVLIEFGIVHTVPSEIVVLRYKSPPVDNVDKRKSHREKDARNRVDFAD